MSATSITAPNTACAAVRVRPFAVDLGEDHHIHSVFSDGKATVHENLEASIAAGLHTVGFVDHARADTDWLDDYVSAVRELANDTPLTVTCGIEVKMLDTSGALDLPADAHLVDRLVIADHQVPLDDGPHHPAAIRDDIAAGRRTATNVIDALLDATTNAAQRHPGSTIAHLFSVLPKCGLTESMVTARQLDRLGRALAAADATVELSERWTCPGPAALAALHRAGVQLLASTDSHRSDTIGIYTWVRQAITDTERLLA